MTTLVSITDRRSLTGTTSMQMNQMSAHSHGTTKILMMISENNCAGSIKLKEEYFDYIFDRGCFHVLEPSSRQRYVNQVSRILRDEGLLFLKTFSAKELSMGGGPYRFSIDEINSIFCDRFVIESFKETIYQGTLDILPKAIFVVLRKN